MKNILTNVDVFSLSSTLPLAFGDSAGPIQLKGVDGLGPVKANVASSPFVSISGEAILGSNVGKRNILIKLGLNPDWSTQTMAELRKLLYEYFMPTWPVTLQFDSTHLPSCQISGIVEDFIPDIFSRDPELTVSIICGRPDFVAVDLTTVTDDVFTAVGFEAIDLAMMEIDYVGNLPTGMNLIIESTPENVSYTGDVFIYFRGNGVDERGAARIDTQTMVVSGITIDGDHTFELNTIPGSKYIRMNYDLGLPANLLGLLVDGYAWPALQPGFNKFGIRGLEAGQTWTMTYYARFGGL